MTEWVIAGDGYADDCWNLTSGAIVPIENADGETAKFQAAFTIAVEVGYGEDSGEFESFAEVDYESTAFATVDMLREEGAEGPLGVAVLVMPTDTCIYRPEGPGVLDMVATQWYDRMACAATLDSVDAVREYLESPEVYSAIEAALIDSVECMANAEFVPAL